MFLHNSQGWIRLKVETVYLSDKC